MHPASTARHYTARAAAARHTQLGLARKKAPGASAPSNHRGWSQAPLCRMQEFARFEPPLVGSTGPPAKEARFSSSQLRPPPTRDLRSMLELLEKRGRRDVHEQHPRDLQRCLAMAQPAPGPRVPRWAPRRAVPWQDWHLRGGAPTPRASPRLPTAARVVPPPVGHQRRRRCRHWPARMAAASPMEVSWRWSCQKRP